MNRNDYLCRDLLKLPQRRLMSPASFLLPLQRSTATALLQTLCVKPTPSFNTLTTMPAVCSVTPAPESPSAPSTSVSPGYRVNNTASIKFINRNLHRLSQEQANFFPAETLPKRLLLPLLRAAKFNLSE